MFTSCTSCGNGLCGQSKAAIDFYLRGIMFLQRLEATRRESDFSTLPVMDLRGLRKKGSRLSVGSEKLMYSITYLDGKGRNVWETPKEAAQKVRMVA